MKILQLVPTLHSGDAIGNNARTLKEYFVSIGAKSEIFYLEADADTERDGRPISDFSKWADSEDTAILLHYALPSPLNDIFRKSSGYRILIYHNITPPEFLDGYPHLQNISQEGRRQLRMLRDIPNLSLADSEYNRLELEQMGFSDTEEMPIFLNFSMYERPPCPVTLKMFSDRDTITFVFVGRVTPSKCHHDLIRFYGFYKRYIDTRCRLIMVGKYDGFERYLRQCTELADRLKLGDILFTGKVSNDELLAYYRLADLFVSMSEHEGFGVPLLESMYLNVPVLAFSAGAVPYTLNGGGVVFHRKDRLGEVSELAGLMVKDSEFRSAVLQSQHQRMTYFSRRTMTARWVKILREKAGFRDLVPLPDSL
ncbi:glycosyltransferase family 4 protein [bacterium]|nr:glycosyltransferase family 4 protein [candidate division CSSED10-310 bacterium]